MSKFQELQTRHLELVARYEQDKASSALLEFVRAYVEQVKLASKEISDSRERNQLRANLRFWGAYIYDLTGTYPNLDLLPSEGEATVPESKPKAMNILWIFTASLVFLIVIFGLRLLFNNRPYSTEPLETPGATSLFVAPFSTSDNPMAMVEELSTGTASALLTQPAINPLTVTVGAVLTQTAVSTQINIATPTVESALGGGGGIFGHVYSQTDIQDDNSCSNHRLDIIMSPGFASDQSIEPATLTISKEGTFRNIVEMQISLQASDLQSNSNQDIGTEVNIPDANGSYMIYIDHPRLTFDVVVIQHLPDCDGNHNIITYYLPTDEYENLESRSDFGVSFSLIVWGPYPAIDPNSVHDGVAKIRLNNTGNSADTIFWQRWGASGDLRLVQNEEFIAYSYINNYIYVTSGGRTVTIPFFLRTPYVDYLQNK